MGDGDNVVSAEIPVTEEMIAAGRAILQPAIYLQDFPTLLGAIYRVMHAVAPVPLVSEAEDALHHAKAEALRLRTERDQARFALVDMRLAAEVGNGLIDQNCALGATKERLRDEIAVLEADHATLLQAHASLGDRFVSQVEEIVTLRRRLALPVEPQSHDYIGPVVHGKPVDDAVHERAYQVVGDILGGKLLPKAREQLSAALRRAPQEKPAFPVKLMAQDRRRRGAA